MEKDLYEIWLFGTEGRGTPYCCKLLSILSSYHRLSREDVISMDQAKLQATADYLNEMADSDQRFEVYGEGEALALARLTELKVYPDDYSFR